MFGALPNFSARPSNARDAIAFFLVAIILPTITPRIARAQCKPGDVLIGEDADNYYIARAKYAASARCPATQRLGLDPATESGRAASTPRVFSFPPAIRAVLPGARPWAHPVAGSRTPPVGVPRLRGSSGATRHDDAVHRPAFPCTEYSSDDRWPSPGS
jgi:hypothetical protein